MTCAALARKHGLWTALTMGLVYITVLTVRMQDFAAKLGWNVRAAMVTSGWLVAPGLTGDVWRYVSSTCGGQCVMTFGVLSMRELLADS